MEKSELLSKLGTAVKNGDQNAAANTAKKIISTNIDPLQAINAMAKTMNDLGKKFEVMEIFLPDLIMAADAFSSALEILKPKILPATFEKIRKGKIVIGTIQGDIHDMGKTIVSMQLQAAGFEVIDLGRDVNVNNFIDSAEKNKVDIIAISTLMTACRGYMIDVVDILKERKLRDKYMLLCGGGGVTPGFAETTGYDAFGETGTDAITIAEKLVKEKKER